ncbi:S49 family peptidase [Rhodopirellula halodulae]|uniref:S49 family peptidase n=1 Tax=Rhodopirellula halodulae TaxID=2894198 RepID=UPI001E29A9B3|nr:S49 family peptidase [Rhodopirellula sp. JC737]MCC9656686.1 S49 family peptidase [Rhodopirellula sp. JC737]
MLLWIGGCSHPVRALVGGNMRIDGDMGVDGDIRMNGTMTTISKTDNTASPLRAVQLNPSSISSSQRIAIVDVDGLLVDRNFSGFGSMGENPVALFREKMSYIEADPSIAAVVLRINSPGGGVTASDMLAHQLNQLRTRRGIPVVACLMTTGTGGAYYLATHSDLIVAHPTSVVGGIGVILNNYNMEDTLGQFNIVSLPIKSGTKIDLGSPERMMQRDERDLLQSMATEFHQRFIDQVQQSRGEKLTIVPPASNDGDDSDEENAPEDESSKPAFAVPFDGRVFSGLKAKDMGLVDHTGYLDDAVRLAANLAGMADTPSLVLLRRDNDRAMSEFDVTPNTPMTSLLPIQIPGLDRSSMPTFLYLWQPDPSIVTAVGN